jgi:F0F1-type ATP synthase assembly protein I
MNEQELKEKKERRGIAILFIPAGLLIGMGIGFLTDKFVAGMYLGLGAGFILFIIAFLLIKK